MVTFKMPELWCSGLELLLAAFLGGVIGVEREKHGQAAGFRTNILIGVGACLIMQVSQHIQVVYEQLNNSSVVRLDPGRIASYAIAGMGFLGAGAIIKGQSMIRGLTTASGLWLVTAVGLAIGCGFYIPAIMAVIIAMAVLYGLRTVKQFFLRDAYTRLSVVVDEERFRLQEFEKLIEEKEYTAIDFISFHKDLIKLSTNYHFRMVSRGDEEWREITRELSKIPGVREISWEEATFP
jgi:putative Mg2+ transporter-C (MgtC) family protein